MEKVSFEQVKKYLIECSGCGKQHLPINELHRGMSYCVVCKENIALCAVNDRYYPKTDMVEFEEQGIWVKEPNPDYIVKSCVSNKQLYTGSYIGDIEEGKKIAKRKKDGKRAMIEEFTRNNYTVLSDKTYAKKCDVIEWGGKNYLKAGLSKQLRDEERLVSNYSFKPTPIFDKTTETIHKSNGIAYLGWELEVSATDEHDQGNETQKLDAAEGLLNWLIDNGLHNKIYFKQDSSILNGFEIVSHPATYSWWKQVNMKAFFDKMKELGLREHDTCGLHVHVSRDALTKVQWWALMVFLSKVPKKLITLSRRDKDKMKYCRLENNSNANSMSASLTGKEVFNVMPPKNLDRAAAVNFNPEHTVEFRLFKSTMSHEEMYASLSTVDALVSFAKEYSFTHIQEAKSSKLWEDFQNHCVKNGYGSLISFMEKKELIKLQTKKGKKLCV